METKTETETETERSFPEEALQHVVSFITSGVDRNAVSLVCKSWFDIERCTRRHVFIGNCYAVSPSIMTRRFRDVRSITVKGKHFLADYDSLPEGWGAHAMPWIVAVATAYPALEEIRLKRMMVTDDGLELIGSKLVNLRVLVLNKCEGFSTHGLASIAANCRNLRMLDLCQSEVDDLGGNWTSEFPNSYTSLEFLNIDCLKSELHLSSLEHLVRRCPSLKALRVNHSFSLDMLVNLLPSKAPQLADLGTGLFTMEPCPEAFTKLANTFAEYKGLKSLSGLWHVNSYYLPTIYPVCSQLTSLNLVRSNLRCLDLVKLLRHCPSLQRLWVLDYIEDCGLEEVAASCKELQELRVLLSDSNNAYSGIDLTEQGLVYVAIGCPKLHSILYCCSQMTNAALLTIAKHRPNLTCLRLIILEPQLPDHLTHQPLDDGYTAIVKRCTSLKRLSITGLVTDRLLEQVGSHGKKLEILCLAFGRYTDQGLRHVLSGCDNLRKLGVRDCPVGDRALIEHSAKLETMRYVFMTACPVSYQACKLLGEKHPRLNVEVFNETRSLPSKSDDDCCVENLYVYRTVAGLRPDMPAFVWSTNRKELLGQPQLEESIEHIESSMIDMGASYI